MDQDSLKLVGFFLPKFLKCWDYRHESILTLCIILSCKKFKVQDGIIVHLNWQLPEIWNCLGDGSLGIPVGGMPGDCWKVAPFLRLD